MLFFTESKTLISPMPLLKGTGRLVPYYVDWRSRIQVMLATTICDTRCSWHLGLA